jgi:hypothetical protein
MSQSQRKPQILFSLAMLLLVYGAFGWLIKSWQVSSKGVIMFALITVVVDFIAVNPFRLLEIFFTGIFGVDVRSLFLVMASATMLVVLVTWLPIVYYIFLMLIAALLPSLDFYELQYNRIKSFLLLLVCQMGGLGLGLVGNIYWWRGVEYLRRYHFLGL